MPVLKVSGTDLEYLLILFDEEGRERREPDGTLLSEVAQQRAASSTPPVTDVFFTSHGWKGDIPAAIEQYDRWIGAMAALQSDRDQARRQRSGFSPLIIGLHWPSLPWGEESISAADGALLSVDSEIDAQVEAYASRIATSRMARSAIRTILEAARDDPGATTLSPQIRDAYARLFEESGLGHGDASGRPGADQDSFDPVAIMREASEARVVPGAPGLLGIGDTLRDLVLMPMRQLSFWKMKDRGRQFGETGGHELLSRLQTAAPRARFHLMGHSFGCIVVSATVAGAPDAPPLPRPVDSIFLVQGALSLWAYAADIPYAPGTPGYFHRILKNALVRGPIVATRSKHDTAVGRFYPLGAQIRGQMVLTDEYPRYGGIGSFGIRGLGVIDDMAMGTTTFDYDFRGGRIYNLESSNVIRHGDGASGAHSDIAHPEVAHAFWSAVLSGDPPISAAMIARALDGAAPPKMRGGGLGGLLGASPPASAKSEVTQTRAWQQQSGEDKPVSPMIARTLDTAAPSPMHRGGLLSASPPASAEPEAPPASLRQQQESSRTVGDQRWINAELEDQDPQASLVHGHWYTLAFDVDLVARGAASSVVFDDSQVFKEGVEEVTLTVQVDSDDFELNDRTRLLRVPRAGRSKNKARFDLSPKHNGRCSLKATFHKDGNFIQQMELTYDVGAANGIPVQLRTRGRPPSAAGIVQARDVGLSIAPGIGGYECVVWGAVSARARLPLQPAFLSSAVDAARRDLMKVVMQQDRDGNYVFQAGIDIPDAARDAALKTMARAGAMLFQKLFFGPAAGADSKRVGEFLRWMASDSRSRLKLQIVAESTPIPWGLLYVGDASAEAALDWDNFIGMRHVIEQIPLQNMLIVSDTAISSNKPDLRISINVNKGIDIQMAADFVAGQQLFWEQAVSSRKRLHLTVRTRCDEVLQALKGGEADDQIIYFYCHAEAAGLDAPGGPDESRLVLTDGSLSLGGLNLDAPTDVLLHSNPLVFINACESAEMSPAFYDGFVPYFMAKGARGVVGTECKTPAMFAAVWAKRFFERFLDGEALGESFLGLRREFLQDHGNPLGLLYVVHCDGDTLLQPKVQ